MADPNLLYFQVYITTPAAEMRPGDRFKQGKVIWAVVVVFKSGKVLCQQHQTGPCHTFAALTYQRIARGPADLRIPA